MRKIYNLLILCLFLPVVGQSQVHTSYLWHLQQPIYWPESSTWYADQYQHVWESHSLKTSGGNLYSDGLNHPLNDLYDIFGKADRVAVYQYRAKDAVNTLTGYAEGGAQVNYSGCLIQNVNSLANAGQWGYYSGWQNEFKTARSWTTSGGNPRMDLTGFTMHHALSPLVSENCLRKQIQAHRYIYVNTFNNSPTYSKGYWPAECSFSERIIKALVEEGFEWTIIANSHLSRTLNDYPLVFNSSGCNMDPPNKADIVPTNGNNWWSGTIDGRGGQFAAPYCYQAHKAKYVDPASGVEYKIDVVPMGDLLSYQNGYGTMGTGDIDAHIAPHNDPSQPSIVLMAHDGDNAWGGGYDYYMNSVPGLAGAASSKGYVPTTIQQFLDDHPVPASDVVHVEDGSWFNAANDWGHPQFINWIWPMYTPAHEFDPNGWTEDARNWAVLVAAENRVQHAEDLSGSLDISDIVNGGTSANAVEKAWHFLLPGFTSGYMYYGAAIDMEVKPTIACNNAVSYADPVITSGGGTDLTPPNVFIPQRFPYNPGGIGFGPVYGYTQKNNPSDFYVWTFAYDVSGLSSVKLKYRTDLDGVNPLSDNENDTYAGGSGVSAWNEVNMTQRVFPKTNITGNPDIDFFVLPDYIADEYYAPITGLSEVLVDYYIEATDNKGNTFKTPIQHVYIGASTPGGGGGGDPDGVHWTPPYPNILDTVTIYVSNATMGANLHWGVTPDGGSAWTTPDTSYWPAGSFLFSGPGSAIESDMSGPDADDKLKIVLGPFNSPDQAVDGLNFVIHWDDDSWDNNGGADYYIPISSDTTTIDTTDTTGTGIYHHPYPLEVSVYPNPVKEKILLHIEDVLDPDYVVELIDLQGRLVRRIALSKGSHRLDRGEISPGIYQFRVIGSRTKRVWNKKLVFE